MWCVQKSIEWHAMVARARLAYKTSYVSDSEGNAKKAGRASGRMERQRDRLHVTGFVRSKAHAACPRPCVPSGALADSLKPNGHVCGTMNASGRLRLGSTKPHRVNLNGIHTRDGCTCKQQLLHVQRNKGPMSSCFPAGTKRKLVCAGKAAPSACRAAFYMTR